MHSIAKKELIKKGIELADTVVTVFELDEKINEVFGAPWRVNDTAIIAQNLEEINELTKKYNLVNKGEIIYEETKRLEELEKQKDRKDLCMALIVCAIFFVPIGSLLIKWLLSI